MREVIAYLSSAALHGGVIGSLVLWSSYAPEYWVSVQSGNSVSTISIIASISAEKTVAEEIETQIITEPEPTPLEVAKPSQSTEPIAETTEFEEVPLAVSAMPLKRITSLETPAPPETTLPKLPLTKQAKTEKLEASVTSVAIPFQASADFGAVVDELPRKLSTNAPPSYPVEALISKLEGRVVLLVRVQSNGLVSQVRMGQSSGHSPLDQAALIAVQQWKFEPARRGGIAVEHEVLVPVSFSIRKS